MFKFRKRESGHFHSTNNRVYKHKRGPIGRLDVSVEDTVDLLISMMTPEQVAIFEVLDTKGNIFSFKERLLSSVKAIGGIPIYPLSKARKYIKHDIEFYKSLINENLEINDMFIGKMIDRLFVCRTRNNEY